MCLILLSYEIHPVYRVVLAANRDEYYDRPTEPLTFWDDGSGILAGRDLKRKGVWLGVTQTGRLAAITNYREPFLRLENAPSRGLLVSDFLSGTESPQHYLDNIKTTGHQYNGFNLLVGDGSGLFYYSNKGDTIQKLKPGLYGLSNHLLDTAWPKIEIGKAALKNLIDADDQIDIEDVFHILADRSYPPADQLPDTGVDRDWERVLSPLFITSPSYGTRSSSVVVMENNGGVVFAERTFEPQQSESSANQTRIFSFTIST